MLSSRTSRAKFGWRAFSIPLAVAALLALAAPVAADPPGNNGTIKLDGMAFDDHPNNEPHVGCNFQVDFYGFDADPNLNAEVIFELHPPTAADQTMTVTSGDLTPFIGGSDNSGGGSEAGLDASQAYTLAFTGTPHEQQGFHVKLTIHAPGAQGADVKHKVFWVTGCEGQLTGNPPPPPPGNGGGGQLAGSPPREGTQASVSSPPARVPNTAVATEGGSGLLVLTMALLLIVGSGTVAAIRLRAR